MGGTGKPPGGCWGHMPKWAVGEQRCSLWTWIEKVIYSTDLSNFEDLNLNEHSKEKVVSS